MSDPKKKAPPCYNFKGPGGLKLAVWKHAGKFGDYFTFSFSQAFQKEGSDKWEYSDYLRQRDLLPAADLLARAHRKLYTEEAGNLLRPAPETTAEESTEGQDSPEPDPFSSKDGDGAY